MDFMADPLITATSFIMKSFVSNNAGFFIDVNSRVCGFAVSDRHKRAFENTYAMLNVVKNASTNESHRQYWKDVIFEVLVIESTKTLSLDVIIEYEQTIYSLEVEHRISLNEIKQKYR